MSEHSQIEKLLENTASIDKTVTRINESLNGRGGWFDRVEALEKATADHASFKTKLIAWGTVASVALSLGWNAVFEWFKSHKP